MAMSGRPIVDNGSATSTIIAHAHRCSIARRPRPKSTPPQNEQDKNIRSMSAHTRPTESDRAHRESACRRRHHSRPHREGYRTSVVAHIQIYWEPKPSPKSTHDYAAAPKPGSGRGAGTPLACVAAVAATPLGFLRASRVSPGASLERPGLPLPPPFSSMGLPGAAWGRLASLGLPGAAWGLPGALPGTAWGS